MNNRDLQAGARQLEATLLGELPALSALRAALHHRLFDRLPAPGPHPEEAWAVQILSERGALLAGDDGWCASAAMTELLRAQDDLAALVEFTALAACDILRHGPALSSGVRAFQSRAETFGFFRYDRARGTGAAQIEDTAPWVAYVTALSRREAPVLAPLIPLDGCARLLEIGGNTGVMAEALLARHRALSATVLDLPAVCHLGRARMKHRPEPRLSFLPGDARETAWPAADAVLFKSVLHDWAPDDARALLRQAAAHLPPGGRVIVCERGALADEPVPGGLSAAANLVFGPFYRAPAVYRDWMVAAGLRPLPPVDAQLDMTFHVIAAEKSA
ncbi:methyltransferase domain-containing protein [Salipiger bermudensis]|uniref:methyltransferase n=1 Tax=Salipiger bermudensis TaxID=344736 RepID=UPI001C9911F1|nr:methyltransferase [Salipiger bermudensis]MBY6005315.1 methyltransferase domain-containing protein [Salipiger bermudensis]